MGEALRLVVGGPAIVYRGAGYVGRAALAVLTEAKRRGISVPRDLSVVGFDAIPEAAFSDPQLTTVI